MTLAVFSGFIVQSCKIKWASMRQQVMLRSCNSSIHSAVFLS